MSREEALDLIQKWLEHKMLWFNDSSFPDKYAIHQAINVVGQEEVDKIHKQLKKNWQDE